MRLLFLVTLLCCITSASASIYISEIMYDPQGSDNNLEYVEVYADEELNLTGYTIEDTASQDQLTLMVYRNESFYALIVEDGYNNTGINVSLYSAGSTIGNGLNNDGDILLLKDDKGNLLDTLAYETSMGANGNGYALCRNIGDNKITECIPTPGAENEINESNDDQENKTDDEEEQKQDFSALIINEFLPDPEGDDNAVLPDGEWIELYNTGDASLDLAGLKICDKSKNCITIDSSHVVEDTIISSRRYLVVYANGKGILNNNGFEEVILQNEEIIDKVSYTDSEFGYSWSRLDENFILTTPTPGKENEDDEQKKEDEKQREDSFISIDKVYLNENETVRFGDVIKVKTTIYKGKTKKSSVKVYVEGISTPTMLTLDDEAMTYHMTLPLQIPLNCDNKHKAGVYTIVIEGLDAKDDQNVTIQGIKYPCITEKKTSNATLQTYKGERLINRQTEEELTGKAVYQSKNQEIKKYALYFFYGAVALIVMYFLVINGRKTKDSLDY